MWSPLVRSLLLALGLLGACHSAPAPEPLQAAVPIVMGQGYEIASQVLGETRRLNIYLPPGYDAPGKRLPVLYLIDGGVDQDFPHIAGLSQLARVSGTYREMIVVGIETRDRRRELAFRAATDTTLAKDYPTHGESAKFRSFLADEVKPWIEARYATDGFDAVMGESLAGLFVTETFLKAPDMFDVYIAVDPSLWWDNAALGKAARDLLPAGAKVKRTLYMAIANEGPDVRAGQDLFASAILSAAQPELTFVLQDMPDERHATIYHRAALNALRLVFANPTEVE